jgi:peptidoglycan hydrolase-like amidase
MLRPLFALSVVLGVPIALSYAYWPKPAVAVPPSPKKVEAFLSPITVNLQTLPLEVKVLRTQKPYQKNKCVASYRGKCIQKIALEEYIEGVVLAEEEVFRHQPERWLSRLKGLSVEKATQEAWALQALAARTYVLYAIASKRHGNAPFDVKDTPADQAYKDDRDPDAKKAVARTKHHVLVDPSGRLIAAEYSASCNSKGTWAVSAPKQAIGCHPRCQDHNFSGSTHSKGMCQWGSFEFARDGETLKQLITRYYPNTRMAQIGVKTSTSTIEKMFNDAIPL